MIDYRNRPDAVVFNQLIDAFERRVLGDEELRTHGAHGVSDAESAPLLAWDLFQIFERENPEQAPIMRNGKAGMTMQRQNLIDEITNRDIGFD